MFSERLEGFWSDAFDLAQIIRGCVGPSLNDPIGHHLTHSRNA